MDRTRTDFKDDPLNRWVPKGRVRTLRLHETRYKGFEFCVVDSLLAHADGQQAFLLCLVHRFSLSIIGSYGKKKKLDFVHQDSGHPVPLFSLV